MRNRVVRRRDDTILLESLRLEVVIEPGKGKSFRAKISLCAIGRLRMVGPRFTGE